MSSHHIVRDQQEPALFIGSLVDFPRKHLLGLLEWSPTVVCTEMSLSEYVSAGHKVDVAMVQSNSQDKWQSYLENQQPVKVVSPLPTNYLASTFALLNQEGHQALNLIISDEELEAALQTIVQWISLFEVVIYTPKSKVIIQKKSQFKKWVPANTSFKLKKIGAEITFDHQGFDVSKDIGGGELSLIKTSEGRISILSTAIPYLITEDW